MSAAAEAAKQTQDEVSALSNTVVARAKALLAPLQAQLEDESRDNPSADALKEALSLFMMALHLDPENDAAKTEVFQLQDMIDGLPEPPPVPHEPNHSHSLDVIIVGAGASGVGTALKLTGEFGLDSERVMLIERGEGVGETFRRWPKEMRFISPSFNQQGWTKSFDLNAVAHDTSPAFFSEHPTGDQYATYLSFLAKQAELRVQARTEVTSIQPCADEDGFEVQVLTAGAAAPATLRSRYVIWAAGEFQYPRAIGEPALFSGSELCMHNSNVRSWKELPGNDFVVIGGYESGMDAAFNLASSGKQSTVVSSTAFWNVTTDDPSTELAPYTADRVRAACESSLPPRLLAPLRVFAVEKVEGGDGGFVVRARWGAPAEHKVDEITAPLRVAVAAAEAAAARAYPDYTEGGEVALRTPVPPLLCTGFEGSIKLGVVKTLFEWGDSKGEVEGEGGEGGEGEGEAGEDEGDAEQGGEGEDEDAKGCAASSPLLNHFDESTKTPGLFLVGPAVRHGELSFCFVYKFRQRFGIVADAIARGLGYETEEAVEICREQNMFMDDFECCKDTCGSAC